MMRTSRNRAATRMTCGKTDIRRSDQIHRGWHRPQPRLQNTCSDGYVGLETQIPLCRRRPSVPVEHVILVAHITHTAVARYIYSGGTDIAHRTRLGQCCIDLQAKMTHTMVGKAKQTSLYGNRNTGVLLRRERTKENERYSTLLANTCPHTDLVHCTGKMIGANVKAISRHLYPDAQDLRETNLIGHIVCAFALESPMLMSCDQIPFLQ